MTSSISPDWFHSPAENSVTAMLFILTEKYKREDMTTGYDYDVGQGYVIVAEVRSCDVACPSVHFGNDLHGHHTASPSPAPAARNTDQRPITTTETCTKVL